MTIEFPLFPKNSTGYATDEDLNNHVGDCPNIDALDTRVTALEQGGEGTGSSIPQIVSESLNLQGSDLVARIGFDGDTTNILTVTALLGATVNSVYSGSSTVYTIIVPESAMTDGARLVIMFSMGESDNLRLVWMKNYSILDFGVTPEQPINQLPQLVTETTVYFNSTNDCKITLRFTGNTTSYIAFFDGNLTAGTYTPSTDTTSYGYNFPTTRFDELGDLSAQLNTSDGHNIYDKTYVKSDFITENFQGIIPPDTSETNPLINLNQLSLATASINDRIPGNASLDNQLITESDVADAIDEAKEVTYTTETTMYETDTQIPHVQGPDGDIPVAPLEELVLHAQNDQGYWAFTQETRNLLTSTQALNSKLQGQIQDLLNRIAVLEDTPAPDPEPVYDMATGLTLHTPALLGLLGITIGGVDNIGTGWTAPSDGLVVVDGASTIGLLTPVWIAVNGINADPSGTVLLQLLGDGSSGEIEIKEGDVITQSGMGNITFYKRVS